MNDIMDILVDNYIYVALGSVFLIIVLIGIVISSNRKRKKEKNPDMVSMSDVRTGSINDVANSLNVQNNAEIPVGMKPLNVAEVHTSNNQPATNEEVPQELFAPMGNTPVAPMPEVKPVPTVDANPYATAQVEEPKEPVFEPVFGPQAIEPSMVQEIPTTPVAPGETQPVNPVVVEPVQEIPSAPTPSPKMDVLDVMDIEPIAAAPSVESNPLNGETPISEQNNSQNM